MSPESTKVDVQNVRLGIELRDRNRPNADVCAALGATGVDNVIWTSIDRQKSNKSVGDYFFLLIGNWVASTRS